MALSGLLIVLWLCHKGSPRCSFLCIEFWRTGFGLLLYPQSTSGLYRFSELAKVLIHNTQGKDDGANGEGQVSYDDVSVFVIPLHSPGQGSGGH